MKKRITNTQLELLTYFRNHLDEEFTVRKMRKTFPMSSPAMWKNIRNLWWAGWIIKNNDVFPTRYSFNKKFLIIEELTKK